MKKMLISTVLLSGLAIAALPNTVNAEDQTRETNIGVKFLGEEDEMTENGIGNLVLGKTPTGFEFADTKVNSGDLTDIRLKADQNKTRYIVVNDDRSATAADATKKPTPWKVGVKYAGLSNTTDGVETKLKSVMTIDTGDLKQYSAGEKVQMADGSYDYAFPSPSDAGVTKAYSGSAVKLTQTEKTVTIPGDNSVIELMKKETATPDADNDGIMGEEKGGQGYALEFSNPVLKVQQATIGNQNKTFTSKLTYVLSNNL